MLIFLENCNPLEYDDDQDRMSALTNLLASHGQKKNIVVASRKALFDIIESEIYSSNDKRYASDILSTYREHAALKESLEVYVSVSFNEVGCKKDKNEICLSYSSFKDTFTSNSVLFLTENEIDFDFYNILGNAYLKRKRIKVGINFYHCLGAGSHCKSEFDRLSKNYPLIFCVVDNDKQHPQKKEGATSSKFSSIYRDQLNSGKKVNVLNVREVENLIPLNTLYDARINYPSSIVDTIDEIKEISKDYPDFIKYFDFKDGLTLKKAIELDKVHGEFWLPILSKLKRFSDEMCYKKAECHDCGQCPKINGFGDKILSHSIELLNKDNLWKVASNLEEVIDELWEDVGHSVTSWGCVSSIRMTRS